VETVLVLARKEAIASGIFFGSTGWSGNVTLLGLLAYGMHLILNKYNFHPHTVKRWHSGISW